jgi:hypothetical protein
MDKQDQERHEVERLMRRAEELGHDPQRVARALGHAAPPQAEYQATMKFVERRSWFGARVARRLARRSAQRDD